MWNKVAIILFFSLLNSDIFAQQQIPFKDRLYYGGNFGLGYTGVTGGRIFYTDISPLVGYKFNDNLSAGPGIIYQYQHIEYGSNQVNVNNYGGRLFGRYLILENLFAHAEYELLSLNFVLVDQNYNVQGKERRTIESVFLGGGYRSYMGPRSAIDILVLYNLNETAYTPYPNPIVRLGLGFGL